ncbi:putative anion transporter 3 [Morus notabilis]|uniref:Putative anion transporter 3 n=1 Tax=Morus notabilis TaxID=981085 RepID=W9RGS2_9ROSA|nr:probable anion transporter 3, chloroplastic [Morus notabilis]EXB89955.1 putative anion transporter 3 [Morus notabilis]
MAATTFTPHPSCLLAPRSNLNSFRKNQLGFEPRIEANPIKRRGFGFSVGGVGKISREREREALQRRLEVRCTAEGIERGMLVGRKSGGGGGGEVEVKVKVNVPERMKVVAMVACVMCLCNADRVVMSVAVVPLAAKLGWSSSFLGIVQSSFLWGYIFSSVIGGALADRYGGKRVMAWGVAFWSLATLLTPWAANHSTASLLAVRAFFGLAEGVAMPCMSTLLSRWFPSQERASAIGISMAGFHLGNVVGLLLTPIMLSSMGISGPFTLFSSIGMLWLTTWAFKVSNDPRESRFISQSELRLIQAGKTDSPVKSNKFPTLWFLLSKLPTWAIIFANITNNWGYFVLLSWMPVYFKTVFNVNLKQAAWFSAVPWGTMAVSGYIAGATSDYLISKGYSLTLVRKIMQSIGFIGPGVALLCLNYAKTPVVAAVLMTIALSLSSFSQAGFLLNMQDIAPQYAGYLHGISNSAGTLAAIVSTVGTGYFVQWLGSFQAFLSVTAVLYFVTAIFWNLFATGERVFYD